MRDQSGRHIRLLLEPGLSLHEAVVGALNESGVTSASMTILGGEFQQLQYCVAPPNEHKKTLISYSSPIDAGTAYMIFGNATLGRDMEGAPLVHCHASICDSRGEVRGGHIVPGGSIIASQPIPVLVTALEGFELRQAFDEETNIPMLKPSLEAGHE
tara:strand:+ start:3520 stop:3990 length:471 start_codon:yes stop_codon:yes gene_type:complete